MVVVLEADGGPYGRRHTLACVSATRPGACVAENHSLGIHLVILFVFGGAVRLLLP